MFLLPHRWFLWKPDFPYLILVLVWLFSTFLKCWPLHLWYIRWFWCLCKVFKKLKYKRDFILLGHTTSMPSAQSFCFRNLQFSTRQKMKHHIQRYNIHCTQQRNQSWYARVLYCEGDEVLQQVVQRCCGLPHPWKGTDRMGLWATGPIGVVVVGFRPDLFKVPSKPNHSMTP